MMHLTPYKRPAWHRAALQLLVVVTTLLGLGVSTAAAETDSRACMTEDPGWGIYDKWSRKISMGQMLAPQQGGITSRGGFDLIVHFHGHYPIRKEFVKTAKGVVLVAIDLGIGSGAYSQAFAGKHQFEKLIASVEKEMARRSGRKKAYVRKLGLSSWSAGYGAVGQILSQPLGKKVDSLILLDSVHAGYVGGTKKLKEKQIEPFLKFARKAARGSKFMFQSHSSIIPPGYAPTREVTHYMVKKLGGKVRTSKRTDPLGLVMFERYDRRNYHVRGYRGNDKPDHCAHLALMKDVIKVHINRRWRSPKGRRGKGSIAKDRTNAKRSGNIHVVRKGDTLGGLARKYGTTARALRDSNGLRKGKPIRLGQELIIPKGSKKKPGSKATSKPAVKLKRGEKLYKIKSGDALTRIAKRHGITTKALRARNKLTRNSRPIQPGQELIIPAK